MDLLHALYSSEVPSFVPELCACPSFQRLRNVGMNCGCEYTQFPRFRGISAYSRYDHSLGAGLIVWHFTRDPVSTAAALLHDISTPVFAHVIDFLHGDHLKQEYTENRNELMILSDPSLCDVLTRHRILPESVTDYHRYPIADNDAPRLSADRLEYTMGNLLNYGFADRSVLQTIYQDLTAGVNEVGEPELCFRSPETALTFARLSLRCSEVYVCNEDRYAMQMLAELIHDAAAASLFSEDDLYRTEPEIISLLTADPVFCRRWESYRALSTILPCSSPDDPACRLIRAKKRYIDPYIQKFGRVTAFSSEYRDLITEFLERSQEFYISGK